MVLLFTAEHQAGTEAVWATGPDKEGQKRTEGPDGVPQEEKKEAAFTSKGESPFYLRNYISLNSLTCMCARIFHSDSCESETNTTLCVCCYRFWASMMMDRWAYKTPSVMSAFTVMLHSEPTTIYRGMSSSTPVWITHSYFLLFFNKLFVYPYAHLSYYTAAFSGNENQTLLSSADKREN